MRQPARVLEQITNKLPRESTPLWVWSERHAGVLGDSQGLVQVRVIEDVPEPIDRFAMRPRVIAEHALDLSHCKRENCVAAALQRRSYRLGTDEFAET